MNCEIIKDLLPLYIDRCCSKETAREIENHLKMCQDCKALFDSMNSDALSERTKSFETVNFSKINERKASVLQSVLLFLSFVVLTVGVFLESRTPIGDDNGFWAFALIIPSAGFLLSLANWYFIRLYRDAKTFSLCSFFSTAAVILLFIFAGIFYYHKFVVLGIVTSVIFCILSKLLSLRYAEMLGKD